jgi:hypothetical protein
VWPVLVEVAPVDAEDVLEVAAAEDEDPVEAVGAERSEPAFGVAFAFGAWIGVRMTLMVSVRKISSKAWVEFVSRSCRRKRKGAHRRAHQRPGPDRKVRPGDSRQRAAQRCQQRPICSRRLRLPSLPTEHRECMARHHDLELLRAARPRQQPDEREHVPHGEIRERPEQAALSTRQQER